MKECRDNGRHAGNTACSLEITCPDLAFLVPFGGLSPPKQEEKTQKRHYKLGVRAYVLQRVFQLQEVCPVREFRRPRQPVVVEFLEGVEKEHGPERRVPRVP